MERGEIQRCRADRISTFRAHLLFLTFCIRPLHYEKYDKGNSSHFQFGGIIQRKEVYSSPRHFLTAARWHPRCSTSKINHRVKLRISPYTASRVDSNTSMPN